ncbi:hypothetical protein FGB62_432g04 [Gracilaria domingensis]|nr:hypothetical protein FGB62_432g04 [Gracilaria domingensis]
MQNVEQTPLGSHFKNPKAAKPPAADVQPKRSKVLRTRSLGEIVDLPFARTRELLWGSLGHDSQTSQSRWQTSFFDKDGQHLQAIRTPSFCKDDSEHRCGRKKLDCNMQLLSDVSPRIQETTIDTKSGSHPEIPRLVLGDLLNDLLRDKSAPVDDPFLIQHSFPSLSCGQSAASKSTNRRHLTPLSALKLFYLTRGVFCSVIAELVDAMTADEEQNDENAKDGSILPLIVRGGNSMCVESFRMMRDVLDEEYKCNWAMAFLTRPFPELGEDGVEVSVAGRSWRKI